MVSLLLTLLRAASGKPPQLVCSARVWNEGVDELRRRSAGGQESGAFLLGQHRAGGRRIEEFLYYDDVDPHCFARGIAEFDGRKFGRVWQHCRERSLTVVADVHVHPGSYGQSESDQQNPMIAEAGHYALILPNYAAKKRRPGRIGIYEYQGARRWCDHSAQGARTFRVGWWPR